MSDITAVSNNKCFEGWQKIYTHERYNFFLYMLKFTSNHTL